MYRTIAHIAPAFLEVMEQVRAHETKLVLQGLVRSGQFGAAVWFMEERREVFVHDIYDGDVPAFEAHLRQIKRSARELLQERRSLKDPEVERIFRHEQRR